MSAEVPATRGVTRGELPLDGTWTTFTWYGGPGVFNEEGPFTFTAPTDGTVDVTDIAFAGDRFEVYNHGQLLGTTSVPAGDVSNHTQDPDEAFASPLWSSGIFPLSAGSHSITIRNVQEFKLKPGEKVRWEVKTGRRDDPSGTASADADGLLTIANLTLRGRLIVTRASADPATRKGTNP